MKHLRYKEGLPLVEYLALEQQLVATADTPSLFTWIVAPTVIYGRHQSAEAEVNEAYCREHGIQVVQRKSGGGCVYADEGNLMISYILPASFGTAAEAYERFLSILAQALREAGLPAVTTAHNDVLVNGRKVSGTACYTTPAGTIVHGTLLYDVHIDRMLQAITPSADKLNKHGVASVRQRVANIRELTDRFKDIHELRTYIETFFIQYNG